MKTIRTSESPTQAPANFRTLPAKVVAQNGDGLFERWHGSGVPSSIACADCGNQRDNLPIYGNWGFSYPNGNSWDHREVVCGACGMFTVINEFTEG